MVAEAAAASREVPVASVVTEAWAPTEALVAEAVQWDLRLRQTLSIEQAVMVAMEVAAVREASAVLEALVGTV